MNKAIKKLALATLILSIETAILPAQDMIIKNDKTQVKSKVTEITDTNIKFKKWENVDGPVYSITKSEVFMILYSNGQTELIKPNSDLVTPPMNQNGSRQHNNPVDNTLTAPIADPSINSINTSINYKSEKVKYKPIRLMGGLESPLSLGTEFELRVARNLLNVGVAYYYTFPEDDYIIYSNFGFLYASLYAPINRLTGNFEKQDKGLFLFGHAGYGVNSTHFIDFEGEEQSATAGGFTWRLGADYFITKGFGISISSFECKSFYGGIVFTL